MKLFEYVAEGDWTPVAGYLLFVPLLAAGYYYNLTFVQLGLIDLGTRLVGMSGFQVSLSMGGLAMGAFLTAVASGVALDRTGWSADLLAKFRLLLGVLVLQLLLTAVAPAVGTPAAFYAWVALCSLSLGVGMPVTFSLTIDFVPVRDRGHVAALVTALAFFAANVYPIQWSIEGFSRVMVAAMLPGVVVVAALASGRLSLVDRLGTQHEQFGVGRFCRSSPVSTRSLSFWTLVLLMFGVFFVDSLGFLRITETPVYISTSWQSPSFGVHLVIGLSHVVGAAMAGVLYTNFERRWLFLWVFGLFSFTHLLYTFDIRTGPGPNPPLMMPLVYSVAVSFYTTLNFALWPDLSTPETVGRHTAIGVGLAGWLATFLSTALALYFEATHVSLLDHLNLVNALALLLFVLLVVLLYVRRMVTLAREGTPQ